MKLIIWDTFDLFSANALNLETSLFLLQYVLRPYPPRNQEILGYSNNNKSSWNIPVIHMFSKLLL